jgi:hypothetical protein
MYIHIYKRKIESSGTPRARHEHILTLCKHI